MPPWQESNITGPSSQDIDHLAERELIMMYLLSRVHQEGYNAV